MDLLFFSLSQYFKLMEGLGKVRSIWSKGLWCMSFKDNNKMLLVSVMHNNDFFYINSK